MDVYTFVGLREDHPSYAELENTNLRRQLDFLGSMVNASIELNRAILTHHLIKGLNAYAIAGLHASAGEYRSMSIRVGTHVAPEHARVQRLMDDYLDVLTRMWEDSDAITLGAYALWFINYVHPFINGNGRTARAFCYYVICTKLGAWLPGTPIIPEMLREEERRAIYVECLAIADTGNLEPLTNLLSNLLTIQLYPA